jgi:hypothetical protein
MPHRPEDELFESHSALNLGLDCGEPGFLVPDCRPCRVHAQLDRQPIILVHGHQERVSIAIEGALTQHRSDLFSRGGNRLAALDGSLIWGSPSAPAGLRMSFRSPGHEFRSISTLEGAARSTVHRAQTRRLAIKASARNVRGSWRDCRPPRRGRALICLWGIGYRWLL